MDSRTLFYYSLFCIPSRVSLVVIAWFLEKSHRGTLEDLFAAFLLAVPTVGFLVSDLIDRQTTFLGNRRWWSSWPHAYIYMVYFLFVMLGLDNAYTLLVVDVFYSIVLQAIRYIISL